VESAGRGCRWACQGAQGPTVVFEASTSPARPADRLTASSLGSLPQPASGGDELGTCGSDGIGCPALSRLRSPNSGRVLLGFEFALPISQRSSY
jgi:hypothetical protein